MSPRGADASVPSARGTGALVGVLALLAGYLWLVELRPRQHGTPAASEAPPLLAVDPGAVARVDIREAGRRLTAMRRGAGWVDARGRPWRSDAVADLVATLAALRPVMVVDPHPRAPHEYGLGRDARRLEVATADGRSLLVLDVGERNPAWTGLYARHAGRTEVLLVGAVLGWELEKVRAGAPGEP